ncbi:MAG TPA: hypothetical protein VGO62_13965, partial [Myxococcota bacterium]
MIVALLVVALAAAAATGDPPAAALSAADPLGKARAALEEGRLDEAKALAGDAPGLLGAILDKS